MATGSLPPAASTSSNHPGCSHPAYADAAVSSGPVLTTEPGNSDEPTWGISMNVISGSPPIDRGLA